MSAVALRICWPVSSAVAALASSDRATVSNAALTSARAASASTGAGSSAGGRTGGATCTTGPYAVPGLTPMPCRVSAPTPDSVVATSLLRVEVAREQRDERVERLVGTLTLGGEHDLLAVLGAEGHDTEDAR